MRRSVLLFLLCLAAPAGATDFYVDPVNGSPSGNGSAANPWRTLSEVIAANLIETRNWQTLPYQPGTPLVTVHAGAPVKAGDTLWLRSGYHGAVLVRSAYNLAPITVAAQAGHVPRLKSLQVQAAQNWVFRGLSISPSYAPPLAAITMVDVDDNGYYGPAWDVEVSDCDIFSIADASGWTADDWVNLASSGIDVGAARVTIRDNRLRNVRFGISVGGADAKVQRNFIDNFSADGLRGLGDNGLFEYNRVQNNLIEDPPDANHDDGFQSWSVGPGGVGTGEVRGVTLRGNVFINATDPSNPLRSSMQAIGCFDGFFVNWVVENNVVVTDHWHGITFLGMRDSRIVNNTVIDLQSGQPGPPWIMVNPHKNGTPSSNVVVRNNLATDYDVVGTNVTSDHNVEFTMANAPTFFVAPPFDLHLKPGTSAVDTGSATLAPPQDAELVPRPQGAGFDLGAYERFVPTLSVGDVSIAEGQFGTASAVFTVALSGSSQTVTVNAATANGTAASGSDYGAASAALTFPPGTTQRTLAVPVNGDLVDEDDETFFVNLTGPVNATIADSQAVGTIVDDDPPPLASIGDCAAAEGNAGSTPCVASVSLSGPSSRTITASYATANGTATAGADYTAASGTLTFTPGQSAKTVSVAVLGDTAVEPDETFSIGLSGLVNATAGDLQGQGTIMDDDAPSLAGRELLHGSSVWESLAAAPGPVADVDLFRLAQEPRASYEVVVDAASGDVGPGLRVERLASDNATVLQTGAPVGVGPAMSLRWENLVPATVTNQHLRVRSGGCSTDCGADDVYRVRAYETTYAIPRFNNTGTQVTVVLLQNASPSTIAGRLYFWDTAGALLHTQPFSVATRGLFSLNASTVPALQGRGGSVTVSNDGRYGELAGKAVALEPATGMSFDSPMSARAR